MDISFWERQTWFSAVDFVVVGGGIVGLGCALSLRKINPKAKILVLEKGILPSGASTKNAGFASFGSLSEIVEDLKSHSEEEVLSLVQKRVQGLRQLRALLGNSTIDYREHGGFELFTQNEAHLLTECGEQIDDVNKLLYPIFKDDVYSFCENKFEFRNVLHPLIFNKYEGQIDTGKMMSAIFRKCVEKGILILNGAEVNDVEEIGSSVRVTLRDNFVFCCKKLAVATNGFASRLFPVDVKPARGQVLVTKPISNLKIRGTFHFDRGYYYFRNFENRIIFGGGRNLDFVGEETNKFGTTEQIQNKLETILKEVILPETPFEIDARWSGIMGMGTKKTPIVRLISSNIGCGIRLSGIGVAIGILVGEELARIVSKS